MSLQGPISLAGSDSMVNTVTPSSAAPTQPSVFDKCRAMTERVALARAEDAYCYFRVIESAQDPEVIIGGQTLVMLGSQQLPRPDEPPQSEGSRHRGRAPVRHGLRRQPLPQRHADIHEELEEKLAALHGQASRGHLLHRLPGEPRHHRLPARPRRRRLPRQAGPRLHHRRRPPGLREDPQVQAQRRRRPRGG